MLSFTSIYSVINPLSPEAWHLSNTKLNQSPSRCMRKNYGARFKELRSNLGPVTLFMGNLSNLPEPKVLKYKTELTIPTLFLHLLTKYLSEHLLCLPAFLPLSLPLSLPPFLTLLPPLFPSINPDGRIVSGDLLSLGTCLKTKEKTSLM